VPKGNLSKGKLSKKAIAEMGNAIVGDVMHRRRKKTSQQCELVMDL
jgi:hypothetical protein